MNSIEIVFSVKNLKPKLFQNTIFNRVTQNLKKTHKTNTKPNKIVNHKKNIDVQKVVFLCMFSSAQMRQNKTEMRQRNKLMSTLEFSFNVFHFMSII